VSPKHRLEAQAFTAQQRCVPETTLPGLFVDPMTCTPKENHMIVRPSALGVVVAVALMLIVAACAQQDPETGRQQRKLAENKRLQRELAETRAAVITARERAQLFSILTCVTTGAAILLFFGGIILGSGARGASRSDKMLHQLPQGDRPP